MAARHRAPYSYRTLLLSARRRPQTHCSVNDNLLQPGYNRDGATGAYTNAAGDTAVFVLLDAALSSQVLKYI